LKCLSGGVSSLGVLDHGEESLPSALANPVSRAAATRLAGSENGGRADALDAFNVLAQQKTAAVVLEAELDVRFPVAGVEFAGLNESSEAVIDLSTCAVDTEAHCANGFAIVLAGAEVVDRPDIVASLDDGASLLAGLDGRRSGEAGCGEVGSGEDGELHIDGRLWKG
jgi:hypothetical protein